MSISSEYTGQIKGFAFEDLKADGLFDSNDHGLGGVLVQLININTNEVVDSTETKFSGAYTFDTVPTNADYRVKFINPDQQNYGFSTGDNSQSSDNEVLSDKIWLGPNDTVDDVNAGLFRFASIGDRVFVDMDADGRQDADETGLGGVTVQLLNESGEVLQTTVSDDQGNYLFSHLKPGIYQVKFAGKDGYHFSPKGQGNNPAIDSDGPVSDLIWLKSGASNHKIDAGLFRPVHVGDRVWLDEDCDGIQDDDEPGLEGITVKLTRPNGTVIQTTTTDANGHYSFDQVRPGAYRVMFNNPDAEDFEFTTPDVGDNDAVDSDANISTGQTAIFRLKSGENNFTIDAGLKRKKPPEPGKIGDFVFEDLNQNGIQDPNEPGIEGATVKLQNSDGNTLNTTTTDANGMYMFNDLTPGDYKVMFVQPDGFDNVSPFESGNDTTVDSDANPDNGLMSDVITLDPGEFDNTLDAGFFKTPPPDPAKIGDFIFNDLNQNGIQDPNEPGIEGATVKLQDADGNTLDTTTTDASGMYMFGDLTPGDYKVMFVQPDGFDGISPFLAGGNSAIDSDANPNNGLMSGVVNLSAGEFDSTLDAGFFKTPPPDPAKIGDFVFNDLNQNGIQDPDEPGIEGATVKLQDADGNTLETTTTDASGMYMFGDLTPGDYKVMFVQPDGFDGISPFLAGGNSTIDSDANPDNGLMSDVVTLDPGEFDNTVDAGFFQPLQPGIDIEKLVRVKTPGGSGQPGLDVCETVGKPGTLTFEYIPFDQFNTQQSSKKGEGLANNGIDDDGTSYVVISDKENGSGDIYFAGNVSVGEIFNVSGDDGKFSSNSFVSIFDDQGGPLLQSARYHTSCSAPIILGDQIYSLTLIGVQGDDGSASLPTSTEFVDADDAPGPEARVNSTVEFQYVVTNTGETPLSNIQVSDDRLSNVVFESGDSNGNNQLDLDETWIYSASEQATGEGTVANKGTVTGEANGSTVMDMDPANYTVVEEPPISGDICEVLGKPEALIFTYRSDDDPSYGDIITNQKSGKAVLVGSPDDDDLGYVVVSNGKFKSGKSSKSSKGGKSKGGSLSGSSIFFQGDVSAGDSFRAAGDFKSETAIQIFEDEAAFNSGAAALQTIEYHTSCSQPIQIGDQLGSVLLSGYQGEDGSTGVVA